MKNFLRPLSLALLVSILPVCAWAQFSGNIQGDVHDPSGASITTATVTLISAATNIQRTTTSDRMVGIASLAWRRPNTRFRPRPRGLIPTRSR
jgi:hypothetical protein